MSKEIQHLKEYLSRRPYWRKIWQIISGTTENITTANVGRTLQSNKEYLQMGLLQYAIEDAIEKETQLDSKSDQMGPPQTEEFKEFLNRLSKYLKCGKKTTWKILTSYIMYEYCGSLNNLNKFKYEMHILPMLSNIWKFYTTERMFKLKILKTCLEFMNIENHPHASVYRKFISEIGERQLWDGFIKQYKFLLQEITSDSLDNDTPIKLWLERNIREQIEILHCLIIMVNYVKITLKDFRILLSMFKSIGFGEQTCCFEAKKIIEASSVEKLKYSVFGLILCLADEFWSSVDKWYIEEEDERIDSEIEELVRNQELAPIPVVYVWVLMHMVLPNAPDLFNNKYSSWIAKVLKAKVFIFFNEMIAHEMFKDTSIVGINVREAMYHLVFITIEKFNQDDSFFNHSGAAELSARLLSTKQIRDDFFEQDSNGLMLIWNNTMSSFPYKFKNLAILAEAIVSADPANTKLVMREIDSIKVYTIPVDEQSLSLNPTKYIQSVMPASFNLDYTMQEADCIPEVALFRQQGVTILKIYKTHSFWTEFIEVLNKALVVGSDLNSLMEMLVSGLKLTLSIFKHESPQIISRVDHFQTVIKQCVNFFVRCCGEANPPMELLSICLDLLTETVKNYRHELITKMNNHKLLPTLFKDSFKYGEMFTSDSFNIGIIGNLILSNDKAENHHLLVISFLKFLRTCLHTNKKDYIFVEFPALIYVLKVIYLYFPLWYASRETVLKDVLYHVVGIINEMFQFTEEELKDPIKNNMQLLTLCCLLDEPWSRILLQMLVISSNNIQFVMENETNWYKGKGVRHVTTIRLILSVLLQILKNRTKIEKKQNSFPLENFIYSENSSLKVIKAVANLLNHPFNNAIPNLACRLLKKFTVELETSMLASLELDPDQVRLMFLQRLRDNFESEDLKSAIIELITAGVCCQSGMTEAFFTTVGVEPDTTIGKNKTDKDKDKTATTDQPQSPKMNANKINLNESVGNFMIEYLIQATMNTQYQHSPLLYNIMDLFHSLWMNQKELLIKDLINDEYFWESLCNPLFISNHFHNRLYAQILNIITKEIHKQNGKICESLKGVLKKLLTPASGHTEIWLNNVFSITEKMSTHSKCPSLLSAWKNLNIVVVKLMPEDFIELSYKIKVTKKCRAALKHYLTLLEDTENIIVCAEIYLFLMASWSNLACFNSEELYQDVIDLLHKLSISYTDLPKRMQQTILSVVVVCFKNLKLINSENFVASNILADSLISIFDYEYDCLQLSLKSDKLQSFDHKTHQGYLLCFAILNELINSPSCDLKADYMIWLNQSALFKNILACAGMLAKNIWTMSLAKDALETLIFYSNLEESVNFIDTELALELWQQFLPGREYFKPNDLGTVQLVPQNVKNWWMIYKRLLMLLTILLKKHTHFVVKEVVMFVSLHEEYLIQILQLVITSVDFYALDLVLIALNLIYELMKYREYWKYDHEQSYNSIIETVKMTVQCSATLVVRPTVLKYFVVNKSNNQTLQSETLPTKNLIRIMDMMTNIISMSSRIILLLSPPLMPLVTDNRDYSYWELQLDVNFSIPKWGDCELTAGTLVCLICLYIRTLQHMAVDKKQKPETSTPAVQSGVKSRTKRLSTDKREEIENEDPTLFVTKPSYSDTTVGFIRLDYLNPFCNLSTVQNFTHSTTVTVFPWHSKLNESHVISALETVLTLLAVQVGPLIKYRTYDKLNMRYISRELSSELQIFHEFIKKKVIDMHHFTGKDRSSFIRKNAKNFMQEESVRKGSIQLLRDTLKRKITKVNVSMQTGEDSVEVKGWNTGIDYIFTDETPSKVSLETVSPITSTNVDGKVVEYIYQNPHFKSKPSNNNSSDTNKSKDCIGGKNNLDKENKPSFHPDDYLQFLSNWFTYVLEKDNK